MCECKENNWCRLFEETQGGKYPPSEHAPGCSEYILDEFMLISLDGKGCVVPKNEYFPEDYEEDEYIISEIKLTRDQYDNLKEFEGF